MDPIRYLAEDGSLLADPPVGTDRARALFAAMVVARTYDRKASALQRQGRLATYAQFEGQEAAQIGSAAALRADDWMVGTYRDAAAMWHQGYGWEQLFLGRMGDERGGSPPEGVNVLPPSITVGAHMIHAVGLSWAERLMGSDRIALTYFGDGATSEGDFHEAMNFAAVFSTPTVFLCQNNGWAISMSRADQTRSETIAVKAVAYGMPGVLVDGNDALAMLAVTTEAVERARSGGGPTLIEALTYRVGPHTTADDASRYQPEEEVREAWKREPLARLGRYLRGEDLWSDEQEEELQRELAEVMEKSLRAYAERPKDKPTAMFDHLYARLPEAFLEQYDQLAGEQ